MKIDLNIFADLLANAERNLEPIQPITTLAEDLQIADAYEIQAINLQKRLVENEKLIGRKIGLTSEAMQKQLGVDQPDVGFITDSMVFDPSQKVPVERFISPRIEAEIAFEIKNDIRDDFSFDAIKNSIATAMIAAEIIDSRIKDWKIKLIDTVADNASSAGVIVGKKFDVSAEFFDSLPEELLTLKEDGQELGRGLGEAVLEHPVNAVVWLAETLHANGEYLQAGDLVLAGAVHASVPLRVGRVYELKSELLGTLVFQT